MADLPAYWFFISDPFHVFFYRSTAAMSIISNMVLIITIRTNTTIQMDNYRYLLFCFAVGDMISSLSHSWISPIVHLTEHGFFFFPKHANDLKSENATLGKIVCLFYVMTYYETFNVLAFHFIYRYRVIVQGKLHEWTVSWRLGHWLVAAIIFMVVHASFLLWGISFSICSSKNKQPENSMKTLYRSLDSSTYVNLYGVNTSDPTVGYVVIEFRVRLNR
ncbi:hypothetical protein PRIPAC_81749 [Pristionchus pacificus]|uniref:G protein-coupled receptor n=1 Tax=Pristionchus pacificus TaxID=54126 RepID=A0A2A6C3H4_PRIPA|nr:hypothetical protein PRIPAC_81749 [Pristionchus pacificus]|eukprot:PDM72583.1 G protein-coupled receptor [Pristionchus pacificus]